MVNVIETEKYIISQLSQEDIDLYTRLFGAHNFTHVIWNPSIPEEETMAASLAIAREYAEETYA